MAKQNRTTLKGYFETGDIPSQTQYADLIDSKLNLAETGVQIIEGTISSSFLAVANHITASGNISASGILTAEGLVISDDATITDDLTVNGNIDLEGDIDVNGITNLDVVDIDGAVDMASTLVIASHITSSGNISSSIGTGSFGSLIIDGSSVDFTNLPTSDPGIIGRLYNDSGTIKISL